MSNTANGANVESPQVGTMNDRKDDSQMQSADGAAVAQPMGRNAEFGYGKDHNA